MTDRVKIDLQCPYCGHCEVFKTSPLRGYVWCPECRQRVFKRYATGVEGELDEHGCYFKGIEPYALGNFNKQFKTVWWR